MDTVYEIYGHPHVVLLVLALVVEVGTELFGEAVQFLTGRLGHVSTNVVVRHAYRRGLPTLGIYGAFAFVGSAGGLGWLEAVTFLVLLANSLGASMGHLSALDLPVFSWFRVMTALSLLRSAASIVLALRPGRVGRERGSGRWME